MSFPLCIKWCNWNYDNQYNRIWNNSEILIHVSIFSSIFRYVEMTWWGIKFHFALDGVLWPYAKAFRIAFWINVTAGYLDDHKHDILLTGVQLWKGRGSKSLPLYDPMKNETILDLALKIKVSELLKFCLQK